MAKPIVRTQTGAKVTLTIELTNLGSWGPDCKLDQVYEQAQRAALGRINRAFRDDTLNIRLLGPVVVEAITTNLEKRG
jgi:hypothetical protein